jgi:hypothetical protein
MATFFPTFSHDGIFGPTWWWWGGCTPSPFHSNYSLTWVTSPPPPPTQQNLREKATCAGIFKQSMGARNWVGIWLSYQPDRLHSLAELVTWNRFLGSLKVKKFGLCTRLCSSTLPPIAPSLVFVSWGRILGRNWDKSRRSFLLAIHSHIY